MKSAPVASLSLELIGNGIGSIGGLRSITAHC